MPPPSRSPPSNPVRLFDKADGEDDFKDDDEKKDIDDDDGDEGEGEYNFKLKVKLQTLSDSSTRPMVRMISTMIMRMMRRRRKKVMGL